MVWNRLIAFAGVAALSGCTLVPRALYNIDYDKTLQADLEAKAAEHRGLAHEAWLEYWSASGDVVPEPGFADGFIDGFADYLDAGGPGGPPAVPPNQYRFGDGTTPPGRAAAFRYADGFAEGARAAWASGIRPNSLVPVFLPVANPAPDTEHDAGPPLPPRPAVLPPPGPVGPKPREVSSRGTRRVEDPADRRTLPPAGP